MHGYRSYMLVFHSTDTQGPHLATREYILVTRSNIRVNLRLVCVDIWETPCLFADPSRMPNILKRLYVAFFSLSLIVL